MSIQSSPHKFLWAIDPFEKNMDLQYSAAKAIKTFTKYMECIIEPVYCFSAYIAPEFYIKIPKSWISEVQIAGQKELSKITSRIKLEGVKPLHVMAGPFLTVREGVERITRLAKRLKTDLVITSTHARKGIKRFALGSFAETLLLYADVPLFFINPQCPNLLKFKHILFPTDFSEESKKAFRQILGTAKLLNSELTIFHKIVYNWPSSAITALDAVPIFIKAYEQDLETKRQEAFEWSKEAKLLGIKVTIEIDQCSDETVAEAIIKKAKRKMGLIAMASRSSLARTTFLGSTTRKVVRASPSPVWVLHPKLKKKEMSGKILSFHPQNKKDLFSVTSEDIEADLVRIPRIKKPA